MKIPRIFLRIGTIGLSLVVLVLILAYMAGSFTEKIEPGHVVAERRMLGDRETDVVHKIIEFEQREVVGTLRATRRTEISPKILATIEEIGVRAGDRVKKGAVLVRLDDRELKAKLEQSRQAVVATEADLRKAESDHERYRKLFEDGAASEQEFEQKESEYRVARAVLEQAREGVAGAETMLSFSVIEAPVAGVVVDKLAEVGDTTAPGRTLLVIYDPTAFQLEAAVPEALASGLALGDRLSVHLDVLEASLQGTVQEIVPQAEAASRSVLVKVAVPAEPGMVEGMFGRLSIPSRERTRLCVADSAIQKVGQLRFIDVAAADGSLERRQVKLSGHGEYGRQEILSGVDVGERVALYGPAPEAFPKELPAGRRVENE